MTIGKILCKSHTQDEISSNSFCHNWFTKEKSYLKSFSKRYERNIIIFLYNIYVILKTTQRFKVKKKKSQKEFHKYLLRHVV